MAEFLLIAGVTLIGIGVLAPLHHRVPVLAVASLAFPAGAAAFLLAALGQLVGTGTVYPRPALLTAAVIGVMGVVAAVVFRTLSLRTVAAAGLAVAGAALVTLVAFTQHLTRLTPDSMDHLMIAVDLERPDAMTEIRPDDLMKRQVGLAMMHTLSAVTERDYLSALSPMFGACAFAFFAWFLWSRTGHLAAKRRWWLAGIATMFLVASNRMLFHAFYVNIHMIVALLLIVAIAGLWMAVTDRDPAWAPIAGVALALTLLFRPESPLVIALVLIPLAVSSGGVRVRAWATLPVLAVLIPWYSLLWSHVPGGSDVSLTAPVFGNIVAVLGSCALVGLGAVERTRALPALADRLVLWGLLGLLGVYAVGNPSILGNTLWVSIANLGPDLTFHYSVGGSGVWMFTWTFALAIAVLAILVHRVSDGRMWTTPILGFGILYLLLPYLRGSPWREGTGDSGSRIVTHILMVIVAFAVLALLSLESNEEDDPVGAEPSTSG